MSLISDAERLERLAADLRVLDANDGHPTGLQLMTAPILARWRIAPSLGHCLVGEVVGHPTSGPGLIKTSAVWVQGEGWARTLTRFYQLKNAADLDLD